MKTEYANPILSSDYIVESIKKAIEGVDWLLESQYDARGTDDYSDCTVCLLQTQKDRLEEIIKDVIVLE